MQQPTSKLLANTYCTRNYYLGSKSNVKVDKNTEVWKQRKESQVFQLLIIHKG